MDKAMTGEYGSRDAPPRLPALTTNFAPARADVTVPEDGQWTMPARDYASTRFSGLDQINARNVGSLQLAWTWS
ncbi:MAG TPA: hypothetical protein VEQ60_11255, partial [Longimicrobium sp.]|nr:hypothetical protein [Longimicrobium sp.]